jgi:hypothetical protein
MPRESTNEQPPALPAYVANALVEPVTDGFRCPIPAHRTAQGRVTAWPAVSIVVGNDRVPSTLSLDLTTWFVTYAGDRDAAGITLPVICRGQDAAIALAEAFAEHAKQGYADARDSRGLLEWCRWWASQHPGVDVQQSDVVIE